MSPGSTPRSQHRSRSGMAPPPKIFAELCDEIHEGCRKACSALSTQVRRHEGDGEADEAPTAVITGDKLGWS